MRKNNVCPHCLRRYSMLALVRIVMLEHQEAPIHTTLIRALVNARVVSNKQMVGNALQTLAKDKYLKRWRRGWYSSNEGVSANDNQLVTKLHVRKLSGADQSGT